MSTCRTLLRVVSSVPSSHGVRLVSQRRPHRPCRPRQDDAGRRHARGDRRLRRTRDADRAGHGLVRPGAGARHHHPRQGCVGHVEGHPDQPGRHPGARRLRGRGGAGAGHGRRGAAAGRRRRGPVATDPLRAVQGARPPPAGGGGAQQGRPRRRPPRRGESTRSTSCSSTSTPTTTTSTSRSSPPSPGRAGPSRAWGSPADDDDLSALLDAIVEHIPRSGRRHGGAAAGAGHQPRRLRLPGPAGDRPGGAGDARAPA